jgi:hypothetical protein
MSISARMKLIIVLAAICWTSIPLLKEIRSTERVRAEPVAQCPSGHAEARLTGWTLNGKTPVGLAKYDEATGLLEVSVDAVSLADGKVLSILIGEDRVGELQPLKDGKATGTITRQLADNARVRVFDADRPIVSANLQCVAAAAAPTVSPSPSPSPSASASPSPSASPTISPGPSTTPNPDPMPKRSPAPSPSPSV